MAGEDDDEVDENTKKPIRGGFCGPAFEQLARGFLENRHGKEREVREGFLVNFAATVRSETKGQKSICAFVHLSWLVHTIRCLFLVVASVVVALLPILACMP